MAKSVPQSMSSRTAVQKALDRAVSGGEGGGLPGAAAEVLDLRGRWFGAAGVADTTTGRERLPEEEFRIGSTTKTFTAALVLQLAAEGVLTLDDTVEQWLPGLLRGNGNDPDRITLRHLLGMTGGVFNYAVDEKLASQHYGAAFLEHRYDRYRPEQLVEVAQSHAPDFAPARAGPTATPATSWRVSSSRRRPAGASPTRSKSESPAPSRWPEPMCRATTSTPCAARTPVCTARTTCPMPMQRSMT